MNKHLLKVSLVTFDKLLSCVDPEGGDREPGQGNYGALTNWRFPAYKRFLVYKGLISVTVWLVKVTVLYTTLTNFSKKYLGDVQGLH